MPRVLHLVCPGSCENSGLIATCNGRNSGVLLAFCGTPARDAKLLSFQVVQPQEVALTHRTCVKDDALQTPKIPERQMVLPRQRQKAGAELAITAIKGFPGAGRIQHA